MKKLIMISIVIAAILAGCSDTEELEEQLLKMAIDFKEAQYTVEYDQIPTELAELFNFSEENVKEFLTEDELERQTNNQKLLQPIREAKDRKANAEVKEITMDFINLPDNSETNTNLEYQMTIQFIRNDSMVDEFSFDGRMRVEKINDEWKVDWDEDRFYREIDPLQK